MSSFYELRMLNKMTQYSIKENAQNMIKAHEDWKTSKIDEAELGRRIRLSPENRAAVIQTMVKIAGIMQKKPEESKYILTIIEICGEIVSIADKPPVSSGFPSFLKLPSEIRNRVYRLYLRSSCPNETLIPYLKKSECFCAANERLHCSLKRNISLALTSKQMRDEVMTYIYNRHTISFSCACEMGAYLREDAFMRQHIRNVKFAWWGRDADKGIAELRNCSLEKLIVVISRLTTMKPNEREAKLRLFFARYRLKPGFPESLGWDELSSLRGLHQVDVELASKRRANELCSAEEKASLQRWLQQLKEPKKD